jgi:YfiR/HmsC-like
MTATRRLRLVAWAAFAATSAPAPVPAQTPARAATVPEYQIKAVFLFNFAQFVEWPASAFPDSGGPLVIGVLGEDPFGSYLDETVRGETAHGRPIDVRRLDRLDEITGCHILFISRGELHRLDEIRSTLRGRSVLTVSDAEGFASRGGMIRFVTDRNRIRLRINLEAARAAHLTLSSKLLRPARIVSTEED